MIVLFRFCTVSGAKFDLPLDVDEHERLAKIIEEATETAAQTAFEPCTFLTLRLPHQGPRPMREVVEAVLARMHPMANVEGSLR